MENRDVKDVMIGYVLDAGNTEVMIENEPNDLLIRRLSEYRKDSDK